jgi:hypothetical protein
MRASIDRDDPSFQDGAMKARIFLDGVEQKHAITADEDRGIVVRFLIGADGKPVRQPVTRELMRETVSGVVRIAALG